ncbi:hypothetical protein GH5_03229 [Leishmania sp. Ghana 2012 LV757]|uniref:hypothetical protein n=1 Tax=Leishmania sp. Ghana 2012 LV757 TaxID=2803181 RepID=UPI001B658F54|nr:hypothetical protein GH5_03229 [Leishmania sp. Ghana 2012 LV757]
MMYPNGVTYVAAVHPAARGHAVNCGVGVGAVNGMPAQQLSPVAVRPLSPKVATAGNIGAAYSGCYTALRPAAGFYPPYAVVKQYAPQEPQAAAVLPGQVSPPPPLCQATTLGTAVPAGMAQQRSASTSGPSCGLRSTSTCVSPSVKRREGHRSARHRHGDGEAAATSGAEAQLRSSSRRGSGGGQRDRARHRDEPPANGTNSSRAPSPSTTAMFWEVLPDGSNGTNLQSAPTSPAPAGSAAHGDGVGRLRRGGVRSEGRRGASPQLPSEQRINVDTKEPHRRRHRCRGEGRGHRDNARRDVNRSESASPRFTRNLADVSRHERSNNRSSRQRDIPTSSAAVNTAAAAGAAAPSQGPMGVTTFGTPVPQLLSVGGTPMVGPPQTPAFIPAAPSARRIASGPPSGSALAPPPPSSIQPPGTWKGRRRHCSRRNHHRARSASSFTSDGSSDAASSRRSSLHSSSRSSCSAFVARRALASSRNHRRRRCRDRRERRGGCRLRSSPSPSLGLRPTPGSQTAGAPALPADHNTNVPQASKKKGKRGGILRFFRRSKSSAAEADPAVAGNAGAPGPKAAAMAPSMALQKALYSASMRSCDVSTQSRAVMTGQQQRETNSCTESTLQHGGGHLQWHPQHPASSGGTMVWSGLPQQGNGGNIPRNDPRCAVVYLGKSKGLFGGLFRKKKVKTDANAIAMASVNASGASTFSGWVSPPSYPSVIGTPRSFSANVARSIKFEAPPVPSNPAPPGGAHVAASLNGTTATSVALMPKGGLFGPFMKKGKTTVAQQQWQLLLQQMEAQRQLQVQNQIQDHHSRGCRGRHRHESHDLSSSLDQRGGRHSRRHASGNRGGNSGGRDHSRHRAPPAAS